MRDYYKLFTLLMLVHLIIPSLSAQIEKRYIAVLDLDPTGISPAESQFLSDRLRTELFETGIFQVVERDKMEEILKEQGFQKTGCTSVECAVEIGQLLNVKEMVAGSIGKIEDVYSISLRIIKVETGAIMKTATKDYKGKLSEVLTEVIPSVAWELAAYHEQSESGIEKKPKAKDDKEFSRVALMLKGGFSFLQYTGDLNKIIDEFNSLYPEYSFEHLSNHSTFGVEGQYFMSERWRLKLGIGRQSILSPLSYAAQNITTVEPDSHTFQILEFERDFTFTNLYIGVNYTIAFIPQVYALYVGVDFGSTGYTSHIIQRYLKDDTPYNYDETYSYNTFSVKLATGIEYYISDSFSLAFEMMLQSIGVYNASGESSRFEYFPLEFKEVVYPEEINASGIQLSLLLSYHL